jgi:hypothetical protein
LYNLKEGGEKMIKTLHGITSDLIDPKNAALELLQEIGGTEKLLKNSIGYITCHSTFLADNEYLSDLVKELPFFVIGLVTPGESTKNTDSLTSLSLSVLTSDTANFGAYKTRPLSPGECYDEVGDSYTEALKQFKGTPKLILALCPLTENNNGDSYVRAFNKASGDVPVFGLLSYDGFGFSNDSPLFTFYNNEVSRLSICYILIDDVDFNPKFYVGTVGNSFKFSQVHVITDCEGPLVKSIDNEPFSSFYSKHLLNSSSGIEFILVLVKLEGTDRIYSRVMLSNNFKGTGYGLFGGELIKGAKFYISYLTKEIVIPSTTEILTEAIKENPNARNILAFSCATRNSTLMFDVYQEFETVRDILGDEYNYSVSLAGGELCPVLIKGKYVNIFHDNSFIICIF